MTTFLQGFFVCFGAAMFFTLLVLAACAGSSRESRREDAADAAHGIRPRWDEAL